MGKDSGGDHTTDLDRQIASEKPGYTTMMITRARKNQKVTRYYLSVDGLDNEIEVTKAQFVRSERNAGFRPKRGMPDDEPVTGGFSNGQIKGRVSYE